jgi:HD-GYP domain-containing protein (c-di-GMP phosphodiesterase class II)
LPRQDRRWSRPRHAVRRERRSKPSALTEDEWDFVRRHTLIGERILAAAPALGHAAKLVRSTHERFDGTGYPDRLAADQIPLGARIIAVCDAFDAMTSERAYGPALTIEEGLKELFRCAGTQFDPQVVEAFHAVQSALRAELVA